MCPKGRPTNNPKTGRFEVRTTTEDEQMLSYCCEVTGKNKSDIARLGIKMVYDELNKK